jgi:hypothetical protein
LPFGLALERARAQQVYRARRKKKSSHGSTSITARSRAPFTTRQIQTNGWNSFCVNVAELEDGRTPSFDAPIMSPYISSPAGLQGLTDGSACCKAARPSKTSAQEIRYSLMQISETPITYQGSLARPGTQDGPDRQNSGEYSHIAQIDRVRDRSTHQIPSGFGNPPVHDIRLSTKQAGTPRRHRSKSIYAPSIGSRHSKKPSKRLQNGTKSSVLGKGARNTVRVTTSTARSAVLGFPRSSFVDIPQRSPSRQKALAKFSRDLERHLIAQEAIRKASLASTTTTSCTTANTIVEFLPYIDEFRANGLAITSSEQRYLSTMKDRSLPPPPTPRKDSVYMKKSLVGVEKTSETFPNGHIDSKCSTASEAESSCSTIIASYHLVTSTAHLPKKELLIPHKKPANKILPWLRKREATKTITAKEKSPVSSATTVIELLPNPPGFQDKREAKAVGMYPHLKRTLQR